MNRSRFLVFMLILASFFIFGCVKLVALNPPGQEQVKLVRPYDLDHDTQIDTVEYDYVPVSASEPDQATDIVLTRVVIANHYDYRLNPKAFHKLSSDDVKEIQTLVFDFEKSMMKSEQNCRMALGLSNNPLGPRCDTPESCFSSCSSPYCAAFSSDAKVVGFWIMDFADNDYALKQTLDDIDNLLLVLPHDPSVSDKLLKDLNKVLVYTVRINSNPVVNSKMFGLCAPLDFKTENIVKAMKIIADFERVPKSNEYIVVLKITALRKVHPQLQLRDSIPKNLTTSLLRFRKPSDEIRFSQLNGTVSFAKFSIAPGETKYISYAVITNPTPSFSVARSWSMAQLLTNRFSLTPGDLKDLAFSFLSEIYRPFSGISFQLGVGIAIGVAMSIGLFVVFLFRVVQIFLVARMTQTSVQYVIAEQFGNPWKYWYVHIPALVLSAALAFGLNIALGEKVPAAYLSSQLLVDHVKDVLSYVLVFFPAVFVIALYLLLENCFKSVLVILFLGMSGFTVEDVKKQKKERSRKANEIRLATIKANVAKLQELVKQYGAKVDLSEEKSIADAIPIELLEKRVKEESGLRLQELLEDYVEKSDELVSRAEEKIELIRKYWEPWVAYVKGKIHGRDVVPLSELTFIPEKWRKWVIKQMIEKGKLGPWNLEGEVLKRVGQEEILQEAVKRGIPEELFLGGLRLVDGKVKAVMTRVGNSSVIRVLIKRITAYAENVLRILRRNNKVFRIKIYGVKYEVEIDNRQNICEAVWKKRE